MRILIIRSPYRYNIQPLDLYSTIFAFFLSNTSAFFNCFLLTWTNCKTISKSTSWQVNKLSLSATQPLIDSFRRNSELLVILNCSDFQHDGQERYCNFRNDYHLPQSNWVVKNAHLWFQGCFLSIFWDPTEFRCRSYSQSGFLATSYFYDLFFLSCL